MQRVIGSTATLSIGIAEHSRRAIPPAQLQNEISLMGQ